MHTSINMFVATLHDYAQAMLDDNCADAKRRAAEVQRHAELMMIDPAFIRVFHERHPEIDPEPALKAVAEVLEVVVEYCRRLTTVRNSPFSACRN